MRTDKEQLSYILEQEKIARAKMNSRRKRFYGIGAAVFCLVIIASAVFSAFGIFGGEDMSKFIESNVNLSEVFDSEDLSPDKADGYEKQELSEDALSLEERLEDKAEPSVDIADIYESSKDAAMPAEPEAGNPYDKPLPGLESDFGDTISPGISSRIDPSWHVKPSADGGYGSEFDGFYEGYYDADKYNGGFQASAGTLTAGEHNDNRDFSEWLEKLNDNERYFVAEFWGLITKNRIKVTVTCGEAAVLNAKVYLKDANSSNIASAVTDINGIAYLFYDLKDEKQSVPASISCVTADGAVKDAVLDGGEVPGEVSLDMTDVQIREGKLKLDLLFMVDTTGSMGDELEYLKVELKDVVNRVAGKSEAEIRTSVNFYRDKGDEYVVRDFAFTSDLNATIADISAQSSSGGGDYPEAVHTALDNAINSHDWDEDSVKLLFLVLDAPPHEDEAVIASLKASIDKAAAMGIRIIPVLSSGSDLSCEVLFRSVAAYTGGTFVFLTDHSGIGGAHLEPSVSEYTVEKLNDLMVRVISSYLGYDYLPVPIEQSDAHEPSEPKEPEISDVISEEPGYLSDISID